MPYTLEPIEEWALRDAFAIAVAGGMMSDPRCMPQIEGQAARHGRRPTEEFAMVVYDIAEALVAERKRR